MCTTTAGITRKPIRLRRTNGNSVQCVEVDDNGTGTDHTASLSRCADEQKAW
ncbi:MAG: hypothetical protein OXE78_02600 [Gammaproteobacteria bacterium]|nr:hypothetical protein [Gammaproteobacteria bacterium]MCY4358566.1 hypothetical protein [Gammaproteobacteria bacterium]